MASDDPPKPYPADLDRTTRILAQLQTELARSKRQLAMMWSGLDQIQRRRTTPENSPAGVAGAARRLTPPAQPPAAPTYAPAHAPAAAGSAADVLIVDDDHELTLALGDLLSEIGYRVATVQQGSEALAYLREHGAPAAVVLDLMMPEMPGATVLEHLRGTLDASGTEIIIFTAADHQYVARWGIDPGSVVRKPYLPMLLERLSSCLGGGRSGGRSAP